MKPKKPAPQVLTHANKFSSIDDVFKALKPIVERFKELGARVANLQHQLTVGISIPVEAALTLRIGGENDLHSSPSASSKVKLSPKVIKSLHHGSSIIADLFSVRQSIEALEAKLQISNTSTLDEKRLGLAEKQIQLLRKEVGQSLKAAMSTLTQVAEKHAPDDHNTFVQAIDNILSKSLSYGEVRMYQYAHVVNGQVCFSTYLHLFNLVDESAERNEFPELLVVLSYMTGNDPTFPPGHYVGLLHAFAPPSEDLLVKPVKSVKQAALAVNTLLELDGFRNYVGSVPIQQLMNPESIKREIFSYAPAIEEILVEEKEVIFKVKKSHSSTEKMQTIMAQLYKEFNGLRRKTGARLRQSIRREDRMIIFYFTTQQGNPPVDETDLEFLKLRFNLTDKAVREVARTINVG